MKVLLYEMSWPEAKEYFAKNDLAVVPVGSNEQHGRANPLGTDHLIAKGIAEEAARRSGTLCLQVIPFGVSPHHRQFWGTISVSPKTLKQYMKDVCLSLKYYGVRKIVLVNGHGGNLAALMGLARELRRKGVFVSVFEWWPAAEKLLPDAFTDEERGHAGAEETSMNLALHSRLVDMRQAVDEKPKAAVVQAEGITLALDSIDWTKSGVFGKQTSASAKKGKEVFEAVVNELVGYIKKLKKAKMEDLVQKGKV